MDIVPGVHRLQCGATSCYLVETEDRLVLVDAGLPATRADLVEALRRLGRRLEDVATVVLTHAHFDHLGVAAELAERGTEVWVHADDVHIARHPYRYRPGRARLRYPARYPKSVPVLASMLRAGAWRVQGVDRLSVLNGPVTELPDGVRVTHTPGHTDGHCIVELIDRDVVMTGDALVTLDPYTGRRGPRVVAAAGTHDPTGALASLATIAATGASTLLPGHGEVWTGGAVEAVERARAAGIP